MDIDKGGVGNGDNTSLMKRAINSLHTSSCVVGKDVTRLAWRDFTYHRCHCFDELEVEEGSGMRQCRRLRWRTITSLHRKPCVRHCVTASSYFNSISTREQLPPPPLSAAKQTVVKVEWKLLAIQYCHLNEEVDMFTKVCKTKCRFDDNKICVLWPDIWKDGATILVRSHPNVYSTNHFR